MSDNPAEKRPGFERWVASLKLGNAMRPSSTPPPPTEGSDGSPDSPLTLDEQATLINRLPKEVIYKLRERDSQRASMPKSDDSTAVFTPPPELLARAKRFQAPPKPERSSPNASVPPSRPRAHPSDVPTSPPPAEPVDASERPTSRPPAMPSSSPPVTSAPPLRDFAAAEAAAFASLESDEEATTYFKPDISEVAGAPRALQADLSRPGDMQWIDGLPSSPPAAPPPSQSSPRGFPAPAAYAPSSQNFHAPVSSAPESHPSVPVTGSVAPAERRLRWVAILVAVVLLAGIYALSRMQ